MLCLLRRFTFNYQWRRKHFHVGPAGVSCGISGELGSAGWPFRSSCVVPLVFCVVVVSCFVVVSFLLFFAGSLLWFGGWGRCAYSVLGERKESCELGPSAVG